MDTAAVVNDAPLSEQVSFVIKHEVKPDHHEDYEKWLHKTIAAAAAFHGHMGALVMKPLSGGHVYEIAVRFASRADAELWIRSEERKALVKELEPIIQSPERLDIKSGIDYWFTSATEGNKPPKR